MARLRVRIELNGRMAGVPLEKMASVVEETRKFFYLLSQDVQIEPDRGEWLASDFDTESLNFTAEYGGPVSTEQVQAFGAAFSGATSLRRATISQFTRIADFLGEDELVGFGLYQSDEEAEPSEWRCLSKRDAMRFGEEIKLLAEAAGERLPETQLPAVMNGSIAGRRLFRDRREEIRREREVLATDPSKVLREMESNFSRRIGLLEGEVAEQSRKMQQIGDDSDLAEERFQKLLSAMETFWAQGPHQFPSSPEPTAPAPAIETVPQKPRGWTVLGVTVAAGIAILVGLAFPELQRQWTRFAFVEKLSMAKPKPPAAPVLPATSSRRGPSVVERPMVEAVAALSPETFIGPLVPLEIPSDLRPKIQSEVRVNILVTIDPDGNVAGASVASTKGDDADLLVTEALRAAKQSRFRPAREGEKTVQSKMVLTFLFKPSANEF
jgi:TonB family protein